MKKRGLYTLVQYSSLEDVETPITFMGLDGKPTQKLSLTEIDSFTTCFADSKEMLDYLYSCGYVFYTTDFYIKYLNNHEEKRLDLVFSDRKKLKEFALNNKGFYKVKKDMDFCSYKLYVLDSVASDDELLRFLRDNDYISERLFVNLVNYNSYRTFDVDTAYIYSVQITKELLRYRTIRGLEIGIKRYRLLSEYRKMKAELENISFGAEPQSEGNKTKPKKLVKRGQCEGQGRLFNPDNL